ncbi:MAG: ATP-binding cassette domain-containing protein [Saprospiraceae bacterium]|nr:MAG: ABC transporter [Bacteroidetes bacterium OLB9]MCO6462777.1 ATP-binding cassette domain-containing protein [Saprospiraceae bacterium]MCZ2338084.1 polysaccharide ABC transporter ATP-binding protein [Chitinophagales bacterium]
MKPAIEVKGVWKEYRKGQDKRYKSLRDSLTTFSARCNRQDAALFWALQDVCFSVQPGESIGIIGRNGAGKSTLLKILSRITPPSKGEVILRGRVASLLEVGTGFHPELTGRENIYFNGSIMGMKRHEINAKFNEIVSFSGVSDFIDTPLKHYSSGMQMRLAFSVAAHLDAEIILIDEVLAVGDVAFQQKCIGKMDEVSRELGKTIVFVSHDLSYLKKLCQKGLWIDAGVLKALGQLDQVVEMYLNDQQISLSNQFIRPESEENQLIKEVFLDKNLIDIGEDITITIRFDKLIKDQDFILNVNIFNQQDQLIAHLINRDDFSSRNQVKSGKVAKVLIQNVNITPGIYHFSIWIGKDMSRKIDEVCNVLSLVVTNQTGFVARTESIREDAKVMFKTRWNYDV